MKHNHRLTEYSTANFLKGISAGKNYTPYKLYKLAKDSSSYKNFLTPHHQENQQIQRKSTNHSKRKKQKKLIKNEIRVEGGPVSVGQRTRKPPFDLRNNQTFYKIGYIQKKSSLLKAKQIQQGNKLASQRNTNKSINKKHNITEKQQNFLEEFMSDQYASNGYITQQQNKRILTVQDKKITHNRQIAKHKSRIIVNITKLVDRKSIQIQEKLPISLKPKFYLQSKQINHIRAQSFVVVEYPSRQIILGNYYKKIYEIASLTKIMTFYTILMISKKYNQNISQCLIEVDQHSQSITGTSADITFGDIYKVEDLLYGLMLPSGNDAAMALAKWGGTLLRQNQQEKYLKSNKNTEEQTGKGNWKIFVKEMNANAIRLKMKSSRYANPHGLPDLNSGSTAQDQAILVSQCLLLQIFRKVVNCQKYTCQIDHKSPDNNLITRHKVEWENTNKLLRRNNFIGVKTGVTATAGPCLATCYNMKQAQKIYIVILLRTNKLSRRFKDTRYILGLALQKLYARQYSGQIKAILKNDAQLDSDNSEQQEQFCYDRKDSAQIRKRNRILTFEV